MKKFLGVFLLFASLVSASEHQLALYYRPNCYACKKVLEVMKQYNPPIILKNVSTNECDLRTLIQVGGKRQVPCLFIDGEPLYESSDIIKWIEANQGRY